jgi:hypothetical protein
MRRLLAVSLAALAFTAGAQSTERARPPGTVPLDEAPPPPPLTEQARASKDEPVVTRRTDDAQTVEEYRVRGKLYAQRVTPKHGLPYILMDHKGDGSFTKLDNSIDGHLSVPQWVLMEF